MRALSKSKLLAYRQCHRRLLTGPVFVYNAGFETARIKELAERFPRFRKALLTINDLHAYLIMSYDGQLVTAAVRLRRLLA